MLEIQHFVEVSQQQLVRLAGTGGGGGGPLSVTASGTRLLKPSVVLC